MAAELLALTGAAAAGLTWALPAASVGFVLAICLIFSGGYGWVVLGAGGWLLRSRNLVVGPRPVWVAVVVAACGLVCWLGARDQLGRGLVLIPAILPFTFVWLITGAIVFPDRRRRADRGQPSPS